FSSDAIGTLKAEVTGHGVQKPTRVEVVTACIDMKVRERISKVDADFVNKAQGNEGYIAMQKSLQGMGEIGSVGPINNYGFTSWCNMGFYDIDFGWGKPSRVTGFLGDGVPVFMNLVTLMDTKCGGGIEAWVNLDEQDRENLQGNQELHAYASLDPNLI
nr:vinorine synthase-like [Tanacetum cinerariifolium]